MDFGLFEWIQIAGSLCFFIFGMKMMSDGIQRAAGSQLRNILRIMTRNRFLGLGTGFLVTAILQSSSATTVMTVSFVNAGLISLAESAGVMMGANIGTTITGWIVSVLGLKIKLSAYSIPLFAVGLPMIFMNRGKLKYWGEFILGFAILFLGLSYLKDAVPDLNSHPETLKWLQGFSNWGFISNLIFVAVGITIAVIVQSSSAAMAVTLTMCAQGWLSFEIAAAMILGENIGTTITAELAALVGSDSAKRSARIHSLFNIIGVSWMVFLLPWFLPLLAQFIKVVFGIVDPFNNPSEMPIALSAFHSAFNLLNVVLLLPFVPSLVRLATWTVPSHEEEEDEIRLKFIATPTLTPELATIELQKETAHFGEIIARMNGFLRTLINSTELKTRKTMIKRLKKYEHISDNLEIEISTYITQLTDKEITPTTSVRLRSMLNICNELERIGDVYFQMAKIIDKKNKSRIYFIQDQRDDLNEMMDLLDEAFRIMVANLSTPSYDDVNNESAQMVEKKINRTEKILRKHNKIWLQREDYPIPSSMVFNELSAAMEKVGNHVERISEAIVG